MGKRHFRSLEEYHSLHHLCDCQIQLNVDKEGSEYFQYSRDSLKNNQGVRKRHCLLIKV